MLHNLLHSISDSISHWFDHSRVERGEPYLEEARTIDELERRMRNMDHWMGP